VDWRRLPAPVSPPPAHSHTQTHTYTHTHTHTHTHTQSTRKRPYPTLLTRACMLYPTPCHAQLMAEGEKLSKRVLDLEGQVKRARAHVSLAYRDAQAVWPRAATAWSCSAARGHGRACCHTSAAASGGRIGCTCKRVSCGLNTRTFSRPCFGNA
jgi:hypothetical protein